MTPKHITFRFSGADNSFLEADRAKICQRFLSFQLMDMRKFIDLQTLLDELFLEFLAVLERIYRIAVGISDARAVATSGIVFFEFAFRDILAVEAEGRPILVFAEDGFFSTFPQSQQ